MRPGTRLGALIALLALVGPRARAHGPAPAVLEVLEADAAGPTWLRATVGLLRRNPDNTWAHICPAHWDGNDRMRAAVAGDDAIVVSAEGYRSPSDPAGSPDLCAAWSGLGPVRVATVDRSGGQLYWVVDAAGSATLASSDGVLAAAPMAVPAEIGTVTSLIAHAGQVVVMGRTGLASWQEEWTVVALDDQLRYARTLHGGAVYGVVAADGQFAPERVDLVSGEPTLGPRAEQLLGPSVVDGEPRVFADGQWLAERAGDWVALGADERRWTCLNTLAGTTYGCSLDGLFRLDGSDVPGAELVFGFVQIGPSQCALCEPDWAHYGGEAGWLDTEPATNPSGERRVPAGGCTVSGAGLSGAIGAIGARANGGVSRSPNPPGALPWVALGLLCIAGRRGRKRRLLIR